eukprot:g28618.t1
MRWDRLTPVLRLRGGYWDPAHPDDYPVPKITRGECRPERHVFVRCSDGVPKCMYCWDPMPEEYRYYRYLVTYYTTSNPAWSSDHCPYFFFYANTVLIKYYN